MADAAGVRAHTRRPLRLWKEVEPRKKRRLRTLLDTSGNIEDVDRAAPFSFFSFFFADGVRKTLASIRKEAVPRAARAPGRLTGVAMAAEACATPGESRRRLLFGRWVFPPPPWTPLPSF